MNINKTKILDIFKNSNKMKMRVLSGDIDNYVLNQKWKIEIEGEYKVKNMKSSFEHIVLENFEKINKHFEQINERFEEIDKRFEEIDKRFEQIDKRFEQIDRRFEKIETSIENIDKRLTIVEHDLKEIKALPTIS